MRLNPLSSRRNVTLNQLLENWQDESRQRRRIPGDGGRQLLLGLAAVGVTVGLGRLIGMAITG